MLWHIAFFINVPETIEPYWLEHSMSKNIWQLCLQHLERELPTEDINTFIRPLEIVSTKSRTRLVAPNSYVRDHISIHYLERIRDIFEHLGQTRSSVSIEDGLPVETAANSAKPTSTERNNITTGLNPRYRFDNFVLGKSNELGYAAASHQR